MKITITRENLLKVLQTVGSVVEKRHTMPILSNLLFVVNNNMLTVTASDSEIETRAQTELESCDLEHFSITLPALKLINIVRSLPDGLTVVMDFEETRCALSAGRSRFKLSTLPAENFPIIDLTQSDLSFSLSQNQLKQLISHSSFAMASQDVRFYLNGMLFDISNQTLRVVATDGHRLSTCSTELAIQGLPATQAILPRKGVMELSKLITDEDNLVQISLAKNYLTVELDSTVFTCKLVDGRFPDYRRVIPQNNDQVVQTDREMLRSLLQRASILSNDKFKGIRLNLSQNLLAVSASNSEQDESHEDMAIDYSGAEMEIGFNVNYILDVLSSIQDDCVTLLFKDANSSCLVSANNNNCSCQHVIMPMRL
ncbi:DNA polymerase III subunit beta [Thiomicrorhabdus sp. 6S2-11]|jgi:DNA polymerase-3 subunit beta|uniref:Beta sliding clamp n=1 Tax=Thiomicrorhabdus marina TaxID=2818442 RepID=A0ABS3Q4Y7_9GAMM|nr:DNA polymerase III subunit beta [Thiomicrorhabdus marina]MBO1927351.1 DNA polymerase III subunit beta [Thiomicrorhabdus marina]